ncbi:MAG: trigger factor [Nitrospirae bacterium]|nr:MAG: trigger factor [Nitrospirota bacterium]
MQKTVEDINSTKKRFTVEVPADVLEKRITDALRNIGRNARIPGFRPGKAPLSLLEKRYGKEVESDVLEKIIPEYYLKAIKEANVVPVSPPVFENYDFKRREPFRMTFTVEIRPKIEELNYEGIEVTEEEIVVTDQDVEDTLERLKLEKSSYEPVEGEIENDDLVMVDYEVVEEEKKVENQFIKVGSEILPEDISLALKGKKKGDDFEVTADFPEDFANKNFAGKKLTLKGTIKEVKRLKLATIDDDFAKDLGYEDVEKLREAVRESIEKAKRELLENKQKGELIDKLVASHQIDVPEGLFKEELDMLVRGEKQKDPQADEEELREKLKERAEKTVKLNMLLDTIAEKQGIDITNDEVKQKIAELSNSMYITPEHFMKLYLPNEEAMYMFRQNLIREKTLDFIFEKTKRVKKSDNPEEGEKTDE